MLTITLSCFLALSAGAVDNPSECSPDIVPESTRPIWQVTIKDIGIEITSARLSPSNTSDDGVYLAIECQRSNTVFYLSTTLSIVAPRVDVTLQVGDSPARHLKWQSTDSGRVGLFGSDQAVPFVDNLPDDVRLTIAIDDVAYPSTFEFELANVSYARSQIAQACGWSVAAIS